MNKTISELKKNNSKKKEKIKGEENGVHKRYFTKNWVFHENRADLERWKGYYVTLLHQKKLISRYIQLKEIEGNIADI